MDKVEITEEMLDDAMKCIDLGCGNCKMYTVVGANCSEYLGNEIRRLREERKNNPGVWDGKIDWESRPWATEVRIGYCSKQMSPGRIGDRIATIQRPKSRARQIAEKAAQSLVHINCGIGVSVPDAIEAAILEYAKETK